MSIVTEIPPSTRSDRRAAANRRNALRSTGPRTPEGKARSALNAVKTGCFARTPLLPGEEPGELEVFVADMIEDLSPATAVEQDLAERVAGLSWRRRRLWRAEEQVIAGAFGNPEDEGQDPTDRKTDNRLQGKAFLAKQFTGRDPGPLVKIADHERRLSGSIDASLRMLLKLQDRRDKRGGDDVEGATPPAPIEAIEAVSAFLAPARRAEFSFACQAAPNEATHLQSDTQPSGLALKGEVFSPPVAPNEASAAPESRPTNEATEWARHDADLRNAPARNKAIVSGGAHDAGGINWSAIAVAAATSVATSPRIMHRPSPSPTVPRSTGGGRKTVASAR